MMPATPRASLSGAMMPPTLWPNTTSGMPRCRARCTRVLERGARIGELGLESPTPGTARLRCRRRRACRSAACRSPRASSQRRARRAAHRARARDRPTRTRCPASNSTSPRGDASASSIVRRRAPPTASSPYSSSRRRLARGIRVTSTATALRTPSRGRQVTSSTRSRHALSAAASDSHRLRQSTDPRARRAHHPRRSPARSPYRPRQRPR